MSDDEIQDHGRTKTIDKAGTAQLCSGDSNSTYDLPGSTHPLGFGELLTGSLISSTQSRQLHSTLYRSDLALAYTLYFAPCPILANRAVTTDE